MARAITVCSDSGVACRLFVDVQCSPEQEALRNLPFCVVRAARGPSAWRATEFGLEEGWVVCLETDSIPLDWLGICLGIVLTLYLRKTS